MKQPFFYINMSIKLYKKIVFGIIMEAKTEYEK